MKTPFEIPAFLTELILTFRKKFFPRDELVIIYVRRSSACIQRRYRFWTVCNSLYVYVFLEITSQFDPIQSDWPSGGESASTFYQEYRQHINLILAGQGIVYTRHRVAMCISCTTAFMFSKIFFAKSTTKAVKHMYSCVCLYDIYSF